MPFYRIKDKHISDVAEIDPAKIRGGLGTMLRKNGKSYYVDGTNGSDTNSGRYPHAAKATIQAAVTAASAFDVVYVFANAIPVLATDPVSYAETIIIPATHEGLALVGVGTGRTQGGLPQIKIGTGSTAMITVRAPGCVIANMGVNGADSTGGGILLDDNGTTKVAFGTSIINSHIKNCKAHATNGAVGGGIYTAAGGSAWQVLIRGTRFYKNLGGIVMTNTSGSVPQDWIIEDCIFGSSVNTEVDVDIYFAADGVLGFTIRNCDFQTVDVPAAASGTINRYIKCGAGSRGSIVDCTFACISGEGSTSEVTFGASGSGAVLPTTVRISKCYGEGATDATSDTGEIIRT